MLLLKELMAGSAKHTKPRHYTRWLLAFAFIVIVGAGYSDWALNQPPFLFQPNQSSRDITITTPVSSLSWPATGQAAIGINTNGVSAVNGMQKPVPIASTAKLLTALSVLQKKPLSLGQQGPIITLGPSDVAIYSAYAAQDGSVVPVVAGEQISEYQMLQAMLLPSANNMADSLADWAFGSLDEYAVYANHYASQLGMIQTNVGIDASGFDPSTTSTASDLVRLGEATMQNPVLAQIVGQATATGIPETTTVKNVNSLLGTDDIVGIKTGNTDQAGGVFVSASKTTISGQTFTFVTALAATPSLYDALYDSLPLISSVQKNFSSVAVASSQSILGSYKIRGSTPVEAVAQTKLNVPAMNGNVIHANIHLASIATTAQAGQVVGSITTQKSTFAAAQTAPIVLKQSPAKVSIWWKLFHP